MRFLLLSILLLLTPTLAVAQEPKEAFRATDLPLPRFASLNTSKAHIRAGPGKKYPIKWTFKKKELPIEIILEFDHWRKIRDYDGEEGWLHKSLLSGRRTALIRGEDKITLHRKAELESQASAYLEPNAIARIRACDVIWCNINVSGFRGWVPKESLWGVYADEIIEK